jgi:hypothetical protein
MTNYQLLRTYLELQKGIAFDELFELEFATICFGKLDSSPFWNNALVNHELSDSQLTAIEQKLNSLERNPAIYFENKPELNKLEKFLRSKGYIDAAEDSLMFHSGDRIDETRFGQIKKVETPEDLEIFLQTFDACFQQDDPQNPYGELGEYLLSAKEAWLKHHSSNRIEYFVAYDAEQPVAVSALTNYKNIGYISNVGSLRAVRGKGYGKLATLYCVAQSKMHGHTEHMIATEEGTYPHQFYQQIGFSNRFTAKLMTKNNSLL